MGPSVSLFWIRVLVDSRVFFGCKEHMPLCIYDNHVWVMGERNAEIFKNQGLGAESLVFQVENELRYLHQLLGTGKPYNQNRLLCMDWRISPSISPLCELCLPC